MEACRPIQDSACISGQASVSGLTVRYRQHDKTRQTPKHPNTAHAIQHKFSGSTTPQVVHPLERFHWRFCRETLLASM